jgi:hypothetical protein
MIYHMFGCVPLRNNAAKKNIVFDQVLSEGQQLCRKICLHRRNVRLQFLILLRDEDYHKCIFSYKDFITYRKNKFPGDLIIENFDDCHQLPYFIQDPPIPRQLYIMLPKEKIFVASDTFTESYIRSKMRELIQIFVKLNAKSIKFMRYDTQKETSNIGFDAGITIPQAKVSQGTRVEKEDSNFSGFQYEMRFDENTTPFEIDHFMSDDFYYLKQEPSWQDIISRRIDYKMMYDKYTFRNTERRLLKDKFINKMKVIELSLDYDWEKYKEFVIDYEIEYHDNLIKY